MKYLTKDKTSVVSPKLVFDDSDNTVRLNKSYKVKFDGSEFGGLVTMKVYKTNNETYVISFSSSTDNNHNYYQITQFECYEDSNPEAHILTPEERGGDGKVYGYTITNVKSDITIVKVYANLKHEPQLILNNFNSDVTYSIEKNFMNTYDINIGNIVHDEGDKVVLQYSVSETERLTKELDIDGNSVSTTLPSTLCSDVDATLIIVITEPGLEPEEYPGPID